jgi:modification methylase
MSDHTPTPDATISDATGGTSVDIPVDATPPAATVVATPEWVCTAASPLAATLALDEHATRTGRPVAVWPTAQRSDTAQRADRYAPGAPKHPARILPDTAARLINQYSQPGQQVLGLFCGSGTTVVEAAYACRDAIGVDSDPRWAAVAQANLAHAGDHGAYGAGHIFCADARWRPDPPRRARHSVDLLIATPPLRLQQRRTRPYDTHDLIWDLENDLVSALSGCLPLLRPGAAVAFVTRLTPYRGELIDPTYPAHYAATVCGLEPAERAAALHIPIRDTDRPPRPARRRPTRRRRATPRIVHDDVLVYRVPTRWQRWLRP